MALAVQTGPPLLRLTLPPRVARFLIAAGARQVPTDSMSVEFPQVEPSPSERQSALEDPHREAWKRRALAVCILTARHMVNEFRHEMLNNKLDHERLQRHLAILYLAIAEVWRAALRVDPKLVSVIRIGNSVRAWKQFEKAVQDRQRTLVDLTGMSPSEAELFGNHASDQASLYGEEIQRLDAKTLLLVPHSLHIARTKDSSLGSRLSRLGEVLETISRELSNLRPLGPGTIGASRLANLADDLQVDGLPLDVSGLDLWGINLSLDDLGEALWSLDTQWPEWVVDQVVSVSEEIQLGIFRVRSDGLAARSTM